MFIILSPTSVPFKFSLESGPKSLSKASLENTIHNKLQYSFTSSLFER